jgi:hypothetical protein
MVGIVHGPAQAGSWLYLLTRVGRAGLQIGSVGGPCPNCRLIGLHAIDVPKAFVDNVSCWFGVPTTAPQDVQPRHERTNTPQHGSGGMTERSSPLAVRTPQTLHTYADEIHCSEHKQYKLCYSVFAQWHLWQGLECTRVSGKTVLEHWETSRCS